MLREIDGPVRFLTKRLESLEVVGNVLNAEIRAWLICEHLMYHSASDYPRACRRSCYSKPPTLTPSDQTLPRNAGKLSNHRFGMLGIRRLDHRQVEAVIGKACQGIAVLDELDQERRSTALAAWPTVKIAQQRGLVFAAKEDSRIAKGQARRDRRKTYNGAWVVQRACLRLNDLPGRCEATPNQRFSGISKPAASFCRRSFDRPGAPQVAV